MVLYELLSGQRPFAAETFAESCAKVLASPPTPLSDWVTDLPPGLEDVVLRCLQKEPEARFGNADELAAALAPYAPTAGGRLSRTPAHGSAARALTPPAPITPAHGGRRLVWRVFWAALVGLAVAIGAGLVFLPWPASPGAAPSPETIAPAAAPVPDEKPVEATPAPAKAEAAEPPSDDEEVVEPKEASRSRSPSAAKRRVRTARRPAARTEKPEEPAPSRDLFRDRW